MRNTVILVGRLVRDLELRYTTTNKPVCEFTLAVDRDKENADFIRIQAWNKTAENLHKYCEKGDMIGVKGVLRHETYEKDGNKKSKDYVLATNVSFLSTRKQKNNTQEEKTQTYDKQDNAPFEEMGREVEQEAMDLYPEDLPF